MSQDLIRLIEGICRDKNIDRDSFIADLEGAMVTALLRNYGETAEVVVKLDRLSGKIEATVDGNPVDMPVLGRIAAQTAKQVIIQKTRERERASICEEFTARQGTIVTGTVARVEGANLIVTIGRAEGFMPRSEQIPGESHQAGDRIRAFILEVRELPNQIKIILSRSHPEFIARLFELEVPEIAERIIEIKALARESGYRTKVAVSSIDTKVDAVGACVGVRGSRIRNIVDELGGEKIDIVRWNESSQILIANALKPAEVQETALCFELGKAAVVVAEDQLSLAIGKRGQNVRLAARLTQWDIDIITPEEYNKNIETVERAVRRIEGADDLLIEKLLAMGCISVEDIETLDKDELAKLLDLPVELAEQIIYEAAEEVILCEEKREADEKAKKEEKAKADAEAAAAAEAGESSSAFVSDEQTADGEAAVEQAATDGESPSAEQDSADGAAPSAEQDAPVGDTPSASEPASGDTEIGAKDSIEAEQQPAPVDSADTSDTADTADTDASNDAAAEITDSAAPPIASEDAEPAPRPDVPAPQEEPQSAE